MTATQEQALRYAELQFGRYPTALQAAIADECDLANGTFAWTADPVVSDGEWYDGGEPLIPTYWGVGAVLSFLPTLLGSVGGALLEWPMVRDVREPHEDVDEIAGIKKVFVAVSGGYQLFVLLDRTATQDVVRLAHGITFGSHEDTGIVTPLADEGPPNGADVDDEQLRRWARSATHVFFRGPSYDGYVIWTAPGADPPEL